MRTMRRVPAIPKAELVEIRHDGSLINADKDAKSSAVEDTWLK